MPSIIRATTTSGLQVAPDNSGSLQLQTNGTTTAVTIDTSQNVGIGTTSPVGKLDVSGAIYGGKDGTSRGYVSIQGSGDTAHTGYIEFLAPNGTRQGYLGYADVSGSGQFNLWGESSTNALAFATNSTERMRIDSSGNVGIGTASPTQLSTYTTLDVRGSTGGGFRFGNTTDSGYLYSDSNETNISSATSKPLLLSTNTTERMRITTAGEVWIGSTTDRGAFNLQCNGTGVWGAGAYTNGSDERIKENITPLDTGLDVVAKLNPVTYKYKEEWSKDQSIQTGFIAQDLLVALEGKNYVDGIVNQSSEYMSVAYQNIIPILTKAIQEQQTIINDLKARIETLEIK